MRIQEMHSAAAVAVEHARSVEGGAYHSVGFVLWKKFQKVIEIVHPNLKFAVFRLNKRDEKKRLCVCVYVCVCVHACVCDQVKYAAHESSEESCQ